MGAESDKLKSQVSMQDIIERYGIEVNHAGFAVCPFHQEKTPSMKIYKQGFKCFGCSESGDGIRLVMRLFGLGFQDAIKKIQYDFGLSTEFNFKENAEWEKQRREREREKKQHQDLIELFISTRRTIERYRPRVICGEVYISDKWVDAVNRIDEIEYYLLFEGGAKNGIY